MLSSCAAFSFLNTIVKHLNYLPTWEVVFFRSIINLCFFIPFAIPPKSLIKNWKKELKFLILRGVSGCVSMALYFYAIEHMRLAEATMLNYTSPIFVLIFSVLFLGERLSKKSLAFILVSFIGIALVLKPDFHKSSNDLLASGAGMLSALTAATAYTFMSISTRYAPPKFIVFTFALVSTLISVIPMTRVFVMPTHHEFFLLFVAGCFATYAQMAMTNAYALLPASVASPLSLATVLFATTWGWLFWGETPDFWSILGGCIVIVSLFGAYHYRFKKKPGVV